MRSDRPGNGQMQVASRQQPLGQVTVDLSAAVAMAFAEPRAAEEWAKRLSITLETLCANESVVDRRALCISPGAFAWEVFADVLVLTSGGNLLDSMSLAIVAVLSETVLPKVEVVEAGEDGEALQLHVDDRPEAGMRFPLQQVPLCVTVAQIQGRFLLDLTAEEELCAEALMCVVVDAKTGNVVGLQKLGRGLLDTSLIPSITERCRATAATLLQQLEGEMAFKDLL